MCDVLVVDDGEIVRRMLTTLFETDGHTVDQACGGAEAIDVLRRRSPDCMVLDLVMPDVDGLSVLHARRQEGLAPHMRVIVLTAKGLEDALRCREAGADEFLTKPFEPEHLLGLVRELTGLTPADAERRRAVGLADCRLIEAIEAARS